METTTKRYRERVVVSKLSVDRLNSIGTKYCDLLPAVRLYMWVEYPTWELEREIKYHIDDIAIISEDGDNIEVGLI